MGFMVIPVTDDLDLFIQDILKYLTKKATNNPRTDCSIGAACLGAILFSPWVSCISKYT